MFKRHQRAGINLIMRMQTHEGECAAFKDDRGRFTSDINKTNTLKLRASSAYTVSVESPAGTCVRSMSVQGVPVGMSHEPAHSSSGSTGNGVVSTGVWRTDGYKPSLQSCREKLEFVFVVQGGGVRGPASDDSHLLQAKLLCKFYAPEDAKFGQKGAALGAVKLRAAIGATSHITAVTFADHAHMGHLMGAGDNLTSSASVRPDALEPAG